MTKDVKWVEWKVIDPEENLKMFCDSHEKYLVPGIEKENTPTSEPEDNPEDNIYVHVIPDEGESVMPNKKLKSSEFTYHKKDANTET